jgi:vacuolar-type H+-ATPase subunit I/STV1
MSEEPELTLEEQLEIHDQTMSDVMATLQTTLDNVQQISDRQEKLHAALIQFEENYHQEQFQILNTHQKVLAIQETDRQTLANIVDIVRELRKL